MGNIQSGSNNFTSQYSINTEEVWRSERGWKLYHGVDKQAAKENEVDSAEVSVFVYTASQEEVKREGASSSLSSLALNFHKRFKTLRHPCLLPYRDGVILDDKIYIVTERIIPLKDKLPELLQFPYGLSWGIYQIAEALSFLHSLDLIHGCVELNSIFVTQRQDWRLCVMDLVTPVADLRQGVLEGILHPNVDLVSKVSTPPELLLFASSSTSSTSLTINPQECQQLRSTQPTHAIDAWQFGCFLYTLFTPSHILTHRADLKNFQVLPKTLHEQYMRLISASPQNRLTLDALITTSTYFVNPLCEACQFLETLQLKENYEKENFWRKLPHLLKDIPTTYAKHKILPHLIQAMEFGSAHVRILSPLLTIGQQLSDTEYATSLAPHIVKWFTLDTRQSNNLSEVVSTKSDTSDLSPLPPLASIRAILLERIEEYIHRMPSTLINEQLFPKVIIGLSDPHPHLRELTVKAQVPLAKYLPPKALNEYVLKGLARILQSDPVPSIRANVVVAVSLMAPHLPLATAKSVLLPCFARALRDPHSLVRLMGVKGIAATSTPSSPYYTSEDIALRLIPTLSPLTLDPDPHTRSLTLQTLKNLLTSLEQNHNQTLTQEKEPTTSSEEQSIQSTQTQGSQNVLTWVFSNLAKKFYGSGESNEKINPSASTTVSLPTTPPPPPPTTNTTTIIISTTKQTQQNDDNQDTPLKVRPQMATTIRPTSENTTRRNDASFSSAALKLSNNSNSQKLFTAFDESQNEINRDDPYDKQNNTKNDNDGWDTLDDDWEDFTIDNERETKIDTKNKKRSL